jgi:cell division protein FtsZ
LLTQAGEGTDVILGLGYDNSLEDKIGITLIATGFQHKDPFTLPVVKKPEPKEEKIIMVLGQVEEEKKLEDKKVQNINDSLPNHVGEELNVISTPPAKESLREELAPKLVESPDEHSSAFMMFDEEDLVRETQREFLPDEPVIIHWELNMQTSVDSENTNQKNETNTVQTAEITVGKLSITDSKEIIISEFQSTTRTNNTEPNPKISTPPLSAASGGYLARPSNIYAESQAEVFTSTTSAEEPVPQNEREHTSEESLCDMQMVMRDDIPAADEPLAHQAQPPLTADAEEPAPRDEAEEQKRRAAERLHKLRNLSFNVNSSDPNNEFENVPAYIRRNMELYGNSFSAVENFYSNYTVKKDENNNTQISTLNTFLDGKKPD